MAAKKKTVKKAKAPKEPRLAVITDPEERAFRDAGQVEPKKEK